MHGTWVFMMRKYAGEPLDAYCQRHLRLLSVGMPMVPNRSDIGVIPPPVAISPHTHRRFTSKTCTSSFMASRGDVSHSSTIPQPRHPVLITEAKPWGSRSFKTWTGSFPRTLSLNASGQRATCLEWNDLHNKINEVLFSPLKMLFVTKPDIFCIPCKLMVCKFPKKQLGCELYASRD